MKSTIESLGISEIDTATTGEDALSKMRQAAANEKPYSIVFIDMIMPIMDGWRLSAEINADKSINSSRLYLLVPEGQMGSEAKMKMLDWFNGYLYKPIKRNMLQNILFNIENDSIDLEVTDLEAVPETNIEETKHTLPKCKVLVAEDHPINQKLLKTFLEQLNCTVITASNGQEVVTQISNNMDTDIVFKIGRAHV